MFRAGCVINVSGFQTRRQSSWKCLEYSANSVLIFWIAVLNVEVSRPVNCTNWRMNRASLVFFLYLQNGLVW